MTTGHGGPRARWLLAAWCGLAFAAPPASGSTSLPSRSSSAGGAGAVGPGAPAGAVDVRAFGAKGDGIADDTAALQAALDAGAGGTVYVPRGTYLVLADGYRDGGRGGLAPPSRTRVVLAPDAVLQARPTSSSDYVVVRIERVSGVTIEGGTIRGERHEHTGRGGEWGFGIGIFGASDVVVQDVTIRDCWGDGLFIEEAQPDFSVMPRNITVRRVVSANNRRQGMSVLGVEGLTVEDSIFEGTRGTPPSAGVDVEPGGAGHRVKGVTFRNCTFRDNAGRGFVADATTGADVADVQLLGGASTGNGWEGIAFHKATGGALVTGMTVRGNGASGIYLRYASRVTVRGNHVLGNSQRADAAFFGIHAQRSTEIAILDNVVRGGEGARRHCNGVALEGARDVTVSGNDLRRSGRKGGLNVDGPAPKLGAANLFSEASAR